MVCIILVPSWSCSQAVSKPVWHIPLLCVQWKTPDDGQRKCPKHLEFYSENKFEKLVPSSWFYYKNVSALHGAVCTTSRHGDFTPRKGLLVWIQQTAGWPSQLVRTERRRIYCHWREPSSGSPGSSVRSLLALLSPSPTQFFQELSIRYYALRTKEGSLEQ